MVVAEVVRSLQTVADEVFMERRDRTSKETMKAVVARFKEDDCLVERALFIAAAHCASQSRVNLRDAIEGKEPPVQGKGSGPKKFDSKLLNRVKVSLGKYYSWPLRDGTPLGEATREILEKNFDLFFKNADTQLSHAIFIKSVHAHLKTPTQKIKNVLSEKQMDKLAKEAEAKAEKAINSVK